MIQPTEMHACVNQEKGTVFQSGIIPKSSKLEIAKISIVQWFNKWWFIHRM